jgi:hypothetical protein
VAVIEPGASPPSIAPSEAPSVEPSVEAPSLEPIPSFLLPSKAKDLEALLEARVFGSLDGFGANYNELIFNKSAVYPAAGATATPTRACLQT